MEFEKLLIKSVDDSLKGTFGEVPTDIIYKHLERNHSLKQEEIPKKLEVFIEDIERARAHLLLLAYSLFHPRKNQFF